MKRIAIIICLIGCVYLTSAKETIYVQYEPTSCIQQYYYKAATNSGNGLASEYYDYHVNITKTERSIVRTKKIGTYKKAEYAISNNLVNCSNKKTHTFQSLTDKVATGENEIFFVEEEGDSYHIYKGISASYEVYNADYFYAHSTDNAFKYNYQKHYEPSEKMKEDSESGVTTMFAGKEKRGCTEQFGVVQMPEHACSSQVSKEYIKDVGLYIEKNADGFFMLKKVDHMEVEDYLKWRCSGFRTDMHPNNRPAEYDKLGGENTAKGGTTQNYIASNNAAIIASYSKNGNAVSDNTPKGNEAISTKFNTTTTGNANSVLVASYNNVPSEEVTVYKYNDDKITSIPVESVSTTAAEVKIPNVGKGRHYVQKGDTLYNLSKKYSISIDELKSWNNLPDDIITIGDMIVVNKSAFVF